MRKLYLFLAILFISTQANAGWITLRDTTGTEIGTAGNPLKVRVADGSPGPDNITEGNTSAEVIDTGSDGHFKVLTEGTEALRVLANGNVGIGTSAPSETLAVNGDVAIGGTTNVILNTESRLSVSGDQDPLLVIQDTGESGVGGGPTFYLASNDGSATASGDRLGRVVFAGRTSSDQLAIGAYISSFSAGIWGTFGGTFISGLDFGTRNSSNSLATRMRITNEGNVGIGTTAPAAKLDVLSVTEQQRLSYDASNYMSTTVGSAGGVTFNAVGTGAGFTFSDPVIVTSPAAQTIAAGNTVAANACGSIKKITAAGAVTTDTTNTFTAPAAANDSCCMDVINVGAENITLDNNTNFVSAGAADVVLGAGDTVRVCSTGASGKWYQIGTTGNN